MMVESRACMLESCLLLARKMRDTRRGDHVAVLDSRLAERLLARGPYKDKT